MYKTGDPHPNPACNLMAFVEYDEHGKEMWTSVGRDSEAPYRLANLNARRRRARMNTPLNSPRIESAPPLDRSQFHTDAD